MANKIVCRTEDEVRDIAKIQLGFDKAEAKYYDKTSALKTVDLTAVDMIVGNWEATSILDNFAMYRLKDSENFAGSKAQVEYNTAFTVNSPVQVIVKKHAS